MMAPFYHSVVLHNPDARRSVCSAPSAPRDNCATLCILLHVSPELSRKIVTGSICLAGWRSPLFVHS